jgi:hypothetical protein
MGTDFPLEKKSIFSGMLWLEKIMISVLSGLNDISHFCLPYIHFKMKAYRITGNLIDWFSSYLKGRRQKIVIKNNSYLLST